MSSKASLQVGQRVQVRPVTMQWMSGDCRGVIYYVHARRKLVNVRLERSGRCIAVSPDNVELAEEGSAQS